jgi:DNA-binding beta-propeller fold protein YncE
MSDITPDVTWSFLEAQTMKKMQMTFSRFRSAATLGLILVASSPAWSAGATDSLPLKTIADIRLQGRTTRLDYQAYDPARHLLFIAHLGDSAVIVVDTRTQKVVATIPGVSQVHGILVIPELGRVYASATGSHQVVAIDESDFKVLAAIPAGDYPDGLAFAAPAHKIYVSDEAGTHESVIDVASNRRVATIPIGGEAGNTQYDPASNHIFVNVQNRNELVEIDPQTDSVVGRHVRAGAKHNHGLLIEPARHLAFVACDGNDRLLVVDLQTMGVLSAHPIGADPDVLAFDPGLRLLYVAGESGIVSMFQEYDIGLRKVGEGKLAPHAHSIAVDAETHRVYVPLQDVGGQPTLRIMEPTL